MTSTISLAFLCIAIFVLFTGQQGAKRETNVPDGSRKPSLPPALRRHYFAARQHFQRDGSSEAYGSSTSSQAASTGPTQTAGNEYGRLRCSPIVKKCRRSPQPPSTSDEYPAAAQPAAAVSGYQQSASQSGSAAAAYQSADSNAYKSEQSSQDGTNSAYPSGLSATSNSYQSKANSAGIASYQSSGQSNAYKADQAGQAGTASESAYQSGKGSSASYQSATGSGAYQSGSEISFPSSIASGNAYQSGKGTLASYQSGKATGTAYQAGAASSAGSYHSADSSASSNYPSGSGSSASYQSGTASGTSYKAGADSENSYQSGKQSAGASYQSGADSGISYQSGKGSGSGASYQSGKGTGASYQSGADSGTSYSSGAKSAYKSEPSADYQSQSAQNAAASSYQSVAAGGAAYKSNPSSANNYKTDPNQQNAGYSSSDTGATNSYKSDATLAPTSPTYQQQSVAANSYQQPAGQQNNYQSASNAADASANAGNGIEDNYQKQASSNTVSAAGGNYQQPSSPSQQSYGEKTPQPPAPPPIEYQTPAPPSTDGYEFARKRWKRSKQQKDRREETTIKFRCRRTDPSFLGNPTNLTIMSFQTSQKRILQIHDIFDIEHPMETTSPNAQTPPHAQIAQKQLPQSTAGTITKKTNHSLTTPAAPLSSSPNPIRAYGQRLIHRVSPLDSLIGPEYRTGAGLAAGTAGNRQRNRNLQRERGQRGRPGTIPFPPAIEQTNEFAYVQPPRQPAIGRGGRPLPRPPNGSDREYGNNGEFGGGGPIGPGGQQFGQRGPQNQNPQGQPPFLIGGRGGGRGGGGGRPPPNGVGILVGQAKTGHFHHIPTSNSKNVPYVNEAHRYYYPPRMPLPLPTCFHNPTGYPCCNPTLNDLMVETYTELESKPKFHTCNINAIAQHLQMAAEDKFNTSFETVAAFDDFAQKIHFAGDLVCKVELGGKYMLAYATVRDAERFLPPENADNVVSDQVGDNQAGSISNGGISGGGGNGGTQTATIGGRKKRYTVPEQQIFGPQLPPSLNDLSRRYSIWI